MRFSPGLVFAVLLGGCSSTTVPEISVRDADFQLIKVLTPAEAIQLQQMWESKREVQASLSTVGGQHYKIHAFGARWLYQTTGHVQLLSMRETPVFQLPDPDTFNQIIGAAKEARFGS